jgi:hypothetical protein
MITRIAITAAMMIAGLQCVGVPELQAEIAPRDSMAVAPRDSMSAPLAADTSEPVRLHAHHTPGEALAIGVATSVAPAVLAVALNPPGSDSDFAWEASLAIGGVVGMTAGPAVGLWSGGRGDLAARGLQVRVLCLLAAGTGLLAVAAAFESDGGSGSAVVMLFGLAGAAVGTISFVHDLAITPSATARGRTPIASLGIDAKGRLVLSARF